MRLGASWLLLLCIAWMYCRQAWVSPQQHVQTGCAPCSGRCHCRICTYHIEAAEEQTCMAAA
jgi:hypothetical protein